MKNLITRENIYVFLFIGGITYLVILVGATRWVKVSWIFSSAFNFV